MSEELFQDLEKLVIQGRENEMFDLINIALEQGIEADKLLKKSLIPGMRRVGELFNTGQYFLPELIVCGKAMQNAIEFLNPLFKQKKASHTRKFIIGTVRGDVHDIGKNIVIMMLRNNGWDVTDLGVDVGSQEFCSAVEKGDYDILGLSALLTMTMPHAAETINALKQNGLRSRIKVMIGGAPVTQEYADKIGADAYGRDAWEAVMKAEKLLGI